MLHQVLHHALYSPGKPPRTTHFSTHRPYCHLPHYSILAALRPCSATLADTTQGAIPLDRATELVSDTPDNGIYSIAIPSIELQVRVRGRMRMHAYT